MVETLSESDSAIQDVRGRIPAALRLCLLTDGEGDAARIARIAEAAVRGGATAVILREPGMTAHELVLLADRLRPVLDDAGGLLLVHDRVDVAAGHAHGAHVGRRSLPPAAARVLLPDLVLGFSAHDSGELDTAARAGCDYAFLSPVLPTASHPRARPLGLPLAGEWTGKAKLPVVWLGGIATDSAPAIASHVATLPHRHRPAGLAALGALCRAADPAAAAAALRVLDG